MKFKNYILLILLIFTVICLGFISAQQRRIRFLPKEFRYFSLLLDLPGVRNDILKFPCVRRNIIFEHLLLARINWTEIEDCN